MSKASPERLPWQAVEGAPEPGRHARFLRCDGSALDAGLSHPDIMGNGPCILSGPLELYPNA